MSLFADIQSGKTKLAVVGLGYVGLPVAVSFSKTVKVIGFDTDAERIAQYRAGIDATGEVGDAALAAASVAFTSDPQQLREAGFLIIAVPTPADRSHVPDLACLREASATVGRNLRPGAVVVYESTVYPGVTEDVCKPILEKTSGMVCGKDFFIGYSPERINPGDKLHTFETIVKVVSGMDEDTTDTIAGVYSMAVRAGVYRAENIRVAEAAKVIENCQRDINIALMNELSVLFHGLGIDTRAVLQAAGTKWNFFKFTPGLVGGHCIGVSPSGCDGSAGQSAYHSRILQAGRQVNDEMAGFVVSSLFRLLVRENIPITADTRVTVLGATLKENCRDVRNTRVTEILRGLAEHGLTAVCADPVADPEEVRRACGIELVPMDAAGESDVVIAAVPHNALRHMSMTDLAKLYKPGVRRVLFDLKGLFDRDRLEEAGYIYWRL